MVATPFVLFVAAYTMYMIPGPTFVFLPYLLLVFFLYAMVVITAILMKVFGMLSEKCP